jgi:hypothetical protein
MATWDDDNQVSAACNGLSFEAGTVTLATSTADADAGQIEVSTRLAKILGVGLAFKEDPGAANGLYYTYTGGASSFTIFCGNLNDVDVAYFAFGY